MRQSFKSVLFDFDGVLCNGKFYEKTLQPDYQAVYDWIQSDIFGDKELVHKWMRNQITSPEINKLISERTFIEYGILEDLFECSVRQMELDNDVLDLVKALKLSGKKVGIVTDNMDVFTQITIQNHQLDKLFDVVINSADHGLLKKDDHGKLFDMALSLLDESIENSLMIDDSATTVDLFKQKGGQGFVYLDAAALKSFLQI